jgi:MFS family permease
MDLKTPEARERKGMSNPPDQLQSNLRPLFTLVGIFFINFLSRIVLAPLLVAIEKELRLSHEEAGFLFLLISLGYSLSMFGSGILSSKVIHRKVIFASALGLGITLLAISLCRNLLTLQLGWFLLGPG